MGTTIDFETRCAVSIKAGASRYADFAEVMCLSYDVGGAGVRSWRPGMRDPEELFESIRLGDEIHAHNAMFEINIWGKIMVKKFGWPEIPIEQWRCTQTEVLAAGLPGSLEGSALALEVDVKKDMKGRRLMLKMSKPRKPTKHDKSVWHEKPDQIRDLCDYCDQDVRAEIAVSKSVKRLSPRELSVYRYDQKVNDRGVAVDRELAEAAIDLWRQHCAVLNSELEDLTFGRVKSASETAALGSFLREIGGFGIPDMQKGTIAEALKLDQPGTVRRALEIRQELAMSSIKKYDRILLCCGDDSRIRGCFQYHGAQTGRWAGRLVQLQNLPRGGLKDSDIEWLVELVKKRDLRLLELLSPVPIGTLLSSLIRSCIVAGPGKKLIVSDFASVEARGLAWAARENWMLDAFRDGVDPYVEMAGEIYGVKPENITKQQRFYGKTAVLGCLGPDTRVVTSSGVKNITDVLLSDKLWDGVEWVQHQGVINKGIKLCIQAHGLLATSDHLCLSTNGWKEWGDVATNPQSIKTVMLPESLPSSGSGSSSPRAVGLATTGMRRYAPAGKRLLCGVGMSTRGSRPGATSVQKSRQIKNCTGSIERLCLTTNTGLGYLTGFPLQSRGATQNLVGYTPVTVAGESTFSTNGGPTGLSSWNMPKHLMGGITRILTWIESKTTGATFPGTYASQQSRRTTGTSGPSTPSRNESQTSNKKSPTYDILLSGPRNRFTVLTDLGPMIVHNCGYQLGSNGLQSQLRNFGVDEDLEFCNRVVQAYRQRNKRTVAFWRKIEDAAKGTVATKSPSKCGPYTFHMHRDWLHMRMPCGRDISYFRPRLVDAKFGKKIEYIGVGINGKPQRTYTYGGKLTENATQAVCRDLLVEAMSRVEKKGYDVVAHVHDEIICEVDADYGSVQEVEQIMCETPDWAKEFPVGAEGFESFRYHK